MKTAIVNVMGKKLFVVDTEIKKADYRPGITNLKLKDDKGNDVFAMSIDTNADEGSISAYGVNCNGVTDDGNLAVTIKMGEKETLDDMKFRFGAKLVNAARCLTYLKNQMIDEASSVDAIFATAEDVAGDAQ